MHAFLLSMVWMCGINTLFFVLRLIGVLPFIPEPEAVRNFDSIFMAAVGVWALFLLVG